MVSRLYYLLAIFVVYALEIGRILSTVERMGANDICSRCQHYNFKTVVLVLSFMHYLFLGIIFGRCALLSLLLRSGDGGYFLTFARHRFVTLSFLFTTFFLAFLFAATFSIAFGRIFDPHYGNCY